MATKLTKKIVTGYFNPDADLALRTLSVGKTQLTIVYIDCLIDKAQLAKTIIEPLVGLTNLPSGGLPDALSAIALTQITTKDDIIKHVLDGGAVIFAENDTAAYTTNLAGWQVRGITEPPTSQVTKGPREGFVEDLSINLSMLRRRLKSEHLAIKNTVVGRHTKTKVSVVYLSNIADHGLVKKLLRQLDEIDIDGIIDSYYIGTLLEEGKLKFLRRVGNSEKPDVIVSRVLEGRIAIVVDGSPIVLTVPYMLIEDLQSPEDYYSIPSRATSLRVVRLIGLILGFLLPGIYVSLQSYHYKVLPINFLVTLLSSIQGISFPPLIEILFVLFLFDILAEASARMPKLLGMALSIIGALVLGETTVQAGIISPPSIVVVAISSIMLFIVPDQVPQVSLLRLIFTILGGIAGFYGILTGMIILSTYIISANGYGTPYLAPIAPHISSDKKDAIIKKPLTDFIKRPFAITSRNSTRFVPTEGEQVESPEQNQFESGMLDTTAKQNGAQATQHQHAQPNGDSKSDKKQSSKKQNSGKQKPVVEGKISQFSNSKPKNANGKNLTISNKTLQKSAKTGKKGGKNE